MKEIRQMVAIGLLGWACLVLMLPFKEFVGQTNWEQGMMKGMIVLIILGFVQVIRPGGSK